ncbi:PREDICTED: uncharacterized protein LOC109332501 [Lupinus angustifolius]|uniref:uncharacterized protein LOC109332501 n=1 Tax=Lupinus angustifolius TaxID=3871 RepID=UPI00092E5708|nr:PREDICTED: uncharacterized protein LOC109332501 [Lupinus angustifolius]
MIESNKASTPAESGTLLNQEGNDKPVDKTLFRQMIGSLRYICKTRPDIAYGVGLVSRFMEDPQQSHLVAVKRVMRYLRGTVGHGVLFPFKQNSKNSNEMVGFSDADWCGDKTDRKSTTRYLFKLGDAPISWCSKKQDVVALSSCEAEYIAACMCACQAAWMMSLLKELQIQTDDGILLLVDNKSTINLALILCLMEEANT